jgi:signal transduction histidine kinase
MKDYNRNSWITSNLGEESLEKSDRSIDQNMFSSTFLSSMGHELRSPFTSILGFTSLILKSEIGEISDERREQLTIVYESARDLLDLINDMMDICMIEAGEIELVPETFLPDDVINGLLSKLESAVIEKGLQYRVDILSDIRMFQDKQRFTQVLTNLVSNSIKFMNSGIIEITVDKICDDIQVSVKDSGIGIKEEDIPRLFEPFAQIYSKLESKSRSTVLGLCLCEKVVNLMKGRIWTESEFGKGSIFTFTVPIECGEVNSK